MHSILPVLLFVFAATVTPGGATMLATTSGARFGFTRSLPLIAGIAVGLALLAAVAAMGLASLLLEMPALQTAVKAIGSAYLLWLAWGIARSGPPNQGAGPAQPLGFTKGILLLWLNPKSWAMTVGAAASFALAADGPRALALLLGSAFGAGACASLVTWCLLGMALARLLRQPWHWRAFNITMAVLLAASIIPTWS